MDENFAAFALRTRESGNTDPTLLSAFEKAGRDHFVPSIARNAVWKPRSLPIECGQTLESPDLQMAILSKLDLQPGQRILEIGTGSGFCTAVMAAQAEKLLSVERFRTLAESAGQHMKRLGIDSIVTVRHGNAFDAVEPDEGPFDRIVVWASFQELPRYLTEHLASGGIAVCAIGDAESLQDVARLQKVGSRFERTDFCHARMQPLAEEVARAL